MQKASRVTASFYFGSCPPSKGVHRRALNANSNFMRKCNDVCCAGPSRVYCGSELVGFNYPASGCSVGHLALAPRARRMASALFGLSG